MAHALFGLSLTIYVILLTGILKLSERPDIQNLPVIRRAYKTIDGKKHLRLTAYLLFMAVFVIVESGKAYVLFDLSCRAAESHHNELEQEEKRHKKVIDELNKSHEKDLAAQEVRHTVTMNTARKNHEIQLAKAQSLIDLLKQGKSDLEDKLLVLKTELATLKGSVVETGLAIGAKVEELKDGPAWVASYRFGPDLKVEPVFNQKVNQYLKVTTSKGQEARIMAPIGCYWAPEAIPNGWAVRTDKRPESKTPQVELIWEVPDPTGKRPRLSFDGEVSSTHSVSYPKDTGKTVQVTSIGKM